MNEKPNLSRKKLAQLPLSSNCKSIILGSLLGDGSLKKEPKYANLRFKFRHSIVQKDHFYWKVSFLEEIATKKSVQKQDPDGYSPNEKILFQSGARPSLTELWKLVCNNTNTLTIRRTWLNHLTSLSLAAWWFDDGSLIKMTRQGTICTDGFSYDDCTILSKYISTVWQINCKVRPLRRKNTGKNNYTKEIYYRIWLNNTELRKLLEIVLPYATTFFAVKKCLLIYKDADFQQRWISKMKELLPPEGHKMLDSLLEKLHIISFSDDINKNEEDSHIENFFDVDKVLHNFNPEEFLDYQAILDTKDVENDSKEFEAENFFKSDAISLQEED